MNRHKKSHANPQPNSINTIRVTILIAILIISTNQNKSCSSNNTNDASGPGVYSAVLHDVSYHNLEEGNTSPDYFHDILKMIQAAKRKTVFPSEVVSHHKQHTLHKINNTVLLTFDDGWTGIHQNAHPLLQTYGMKAAAFIHTQAPNQNLECNCSWNILRTMALSGTWEIHSHSVTHANLTELSDSKLNDELSASIKHFRQQGFVHNLFIAYPFGANSGEVQTAAKNAGYQAGFAALPKVKITQRDHPYALPRSTICQLFDQPMVCRKLGLNLETVRNTIAIFDETEGEYHGRWQQHFFHDEAEPGSTCGQLGYRYALSQSNQASWQISYNVNRSGFYSISTWTPANTTQKPGSHIWEIKNNEDQRIGKGVIRHYKANGWSILSTVWLNKGKITLQLRKNGLDTTALLVDAIKIERKF